MTNLVLFGDSITAGMTDGYPSPIFSNEIRKYFPNIEILNRGVPGDRTDLALSRIQADVIQSSPDIVTIFFGTNDVTDVFSSLLGLLELAYKHSILIKSYLNMLKE